MKVVILAGGYGTRLAEFTDVIPKPMVPVGGKPILLHIMQTYASRGFNEFILALGYKADVIKQYFLNYASINSDFTVSMSDGSIEFHNSSSLDWKVTLVDTGLNTMTGGRVKRLKDHINDETFMLTYGDGVSDVDVGEVLKFHKQHGQMVTVTTVRPSARFGELDIKEDTVNSFTEKPQTSKGWINGGYFVIEPEFIDSIDGDETILERQPLEGVAHKGQLMAYRHEGFWQCMDTVRDRDYLEKLWATGDAPWLVRE
ncbi:glucose-1-phosphate cytidylyltransferase [Pseudomonadales bacterium]|nr:glucose-1-phosphate cytidylyltransferase [Pseudomonadales bacterium]